MTDYWDTRGGVQEKCRGEERNIGNDVISVRAQGDDKIDLHRGAVTSDDHGKVKHYHRAQ